MFQDIVDLRDKLHVAILNPVVHHLHVVARADWTDVGGARSVIHLNREISY